MNNFGVSLCETNLYWFWHSQNTTIFHSSFFNIHYSLIV